MPETDGTPGSPPGRGPALGSAGTGQRPQDRPAHSGPAEPGEADRPRSQDSAPSPSAAERARTLVEGNSSATLDIPGCGFPEPDAGVPAARAVLPGGDVLLLMPGGCAAARLAAHAQDDDLAAVLELTDVAPVAVPHRIRGRAWIAGWLSPVEAEEQAACAMLLAEQRPVGEILGLQERAESAEPGSWFESRCQDRPRRTAPSERPRHADFPGRGRRLAWTLLRLEVGEVFVDDLWGAQSAEPEEFAAIGSDPLAAWEAELLQHLAAAHGDRLRGLCSLLGERNPMCARGAESATIRAAPVALDRFGLRVRFHGDDGLFDARFDFPEPVACREDLRRAMLALFAAADAQGRA